MPFCKGDGGVGSILGEEALLVGDNGNGDVFRGAFGEGCACLEAMWSVTSMLESFRVMLRSGGSCLVGETAVLPARCLGSGGPRCLRFGWSLGLIEWCFRRFISSGLGFRSLNKSMCHLRKRPTSNWDAPWGPSSDAGLWRSHLALVGAFGDRTSSVPRIHWRRSTAVRS